MNRGPAHDEVFSTAWARRKAARARLEAVSGALFVVLAFGAGSPALAQSRPSSSVGSQALAVTYEDCLARAKTALELEGYRSERSGNTYSGSKGMHRATIVCDDTPHPDRKIDVHVFVASASADANLPGTERTKLQGRLNAAITTGGAGIIRTLERYTTTERIVVYYSALPGNETDWVSVVPAGAPDTSYVNGQWEFTNGKKNGSFTLGPLPEGRYEARVYFDWSTSSYEVRARYSFEVRE